MKYLITKDRKVIDLEDKNISSYEYIDKQTAQSKWNLEEEFYDVYYHDRNKGNYKKSDNKGGNSMDRFKKSEIVAICDTLEQVLESQCVTIPCKEYEKLKQASEELKECKERLERKEDFIKRLLTPYVKANIPENVFEQISNNKFIKNDIKLYDYIENPNYITVINSMLVERNPK